MFQALRHVFQAPEDDEDGGAAVVDDYDLEDEDDDTGWLRSVAAVSGDDDDTPDMDDADAAADEPVADEPEEPAAENEPDVDIGEDDTGEAVDDTPVEDATPEPEPAPAPIPEPAPVQWPPELLQRAEALHFTPADVQALGNPQALALAVAREERAWNAYHAKNAPAPEPEVDPEPEGPTLADMRAQMLEAGIDESVIQYFERSEQERIANEESLRQQNAELLNWRQTTEQSLAEQAEQRKAEEQRQATREFASFVDNQIQSMPERVQKLVGTQPLEQLDPNSEEFAHRAELVGNILAYQNAWESFGYMHPYDPKIATDAMYRAFGDHIRTEAREDLANRVRSNGTKTTPRPSASKPEKPTGRAAALDFVRNHPALQINDSSEED